MASGKAAPRLKERKMAKAKDESVAEDAPEVELYTEEFIEEDVWYEPAGPSLAARLIAEAAGTFILVLLGVGAALLLPFRNNDSVTVGLAFGIGAMIAIVIFGGISGAHLNPAVTLGLWIAGRFRGRDVGFYAAAQVLGGLAAGGLLVILINANPGLAAALTNGGDAKQLMAGASNGFGEHSPTVFADYGIGGFSMGAALIVEVIATAVLVGVVIAVTSARAPRGVAPFAIGLTLAILVVWTIPFTNAALNPARALASAAFAGDWALSQLWVFWVAPLLGAAIAGLLFRAFAPEEEYEVVEVLDVIED
jgi:aquaporin Z